MIKRFWVQNFCSIGEMQEISLAISGKDALDTSSIPSGGPKKEYLNLVSCIIGENASGKTAFLKAITFLFWFITTAYKESDPTQPIPFDPHALWEGHNSILGIEFYYKGQLHRFEIEFNDSEIVHEIYSIKKTTKMMTVFELTRNKKNNVKLLGNIKLNKGDSDRFIHNRSNLPLMSALIDTAYLKDFKFFRQIYSNVTRAGYRGPQRGVAFAVSQTLSKDIDLRSPALTFLRDIDIGVDDFSFETVEVKNTQGEISPVDVLVFNHTTQKGKFDLNIFDESNGTQQALFIFVKISPILQEGGIVFLDEIDGGLHPDIVRKLIYLFENRKTNPNGAQIIFTTHQHLLLNDRTKTQIFITEKDSGSLESNLSRLDEFEGIRNDDNYFHKYISGTYGGVPHINWDGSR